MPSKILLFSLFVLLWQGACADFRRGAAPEAGPDLGREVPRVLVDDPVFENEVHPILQNMCAPCHSPGNEAQNTRYVLTRYPRDDRPMILDLVFPADPEASLLLRKGRGEDNHQGGIRLPPDGLEYPTVRNWIASLAGQ